MIKNESNIKMEQEIQKALTILREGGIILYPTDTIWGIGCDATNKEAVEKIYAIKERASSKSMIVLLDDDRKLKKYVREVPEVAWDILDHASTPTTIIYPGAYNLPKELIAEDGTIAIRIIKDGFAHQLAKRLNKPLVSTSANLSGSPSPKDFKDITSEILKAIPHVVHLPTFKSGSKASSIIKIGLNGEFSIIRK